MGRREKPLTREQIDYRNSLLRGRISGIKNAEKHPLPGPLSHEDKIRKCFYYLNNCVWWLNEYIDGNIDAAGLLPATRAMQEHARSLEQLLTEAALHPSTSTSNSEA